jgi:hypothetical protein
VIGAYERWFNIASAKARTAGIALAETRRCATAR